MKLKMQTENITKKNIELIGTIFPNCITETRALNGDLIKTIDFDLLKQELKDEIVEGNKERYRLEWPGKKDALISANKSINKTLRPMLNDSGNFDTSKNLYIEGDNLESLKLLQETYLNKVKMIYIDPPYNTGNDFLYKDKFVKDKNLDFEESGQFSEEGRLKANLESNGRFHSDWLTMMYPRLKLARTLLSDDGFIFISIDDTEVANLRKICDEIFGAENFITEFVWRKKKETANDGKDISSKSEYILSYKKNSQTYFKRLPLKEEYLKQSYSNPNNDPRGLWRGVSIKLSVGHQGGGYKYKIVTPSGKEYDEEWTLPQNTFLALLNDDRIYFGKNDDSQPQKKIFALESRGQIADNLLLEHGTNKEGKNMILKLFNKAFFDTPKPVALIEHFLKLTTDNDDIVLDFFSGSSTTAHAVMQLNAEDGGNRRFIMVQIPEETDEKSEAYKAGYKTICEIGKERIRRSGTKILEENKDKEGIENLDIGFRVFKVDSSNMKDVYYNPDEIRQDNLFEMISNIKDGRTDLDLLFQVLLDSGVELTLPIEEKQIVGKKVYFVDGNVLAACFEDNLTEEFVTELSKCEDLLKVVFRDSSFGSDDSRINVEQIFKQYSPDTQIRVI